MLIYYYFILTGSAAWRTVPVMLDIAWRIEKLVPDAWLKKVRIQLRNY